MLSRSFKTVESIRNYLNGVKLMHLFTAHPYPDFTSFDLKLALRGLKRLNPHCPKQALPITPPILLQFFKFLDMRSPADATYWCLFLFAFFLMLRKSNLVPSSTKKFDPATMLSRGDIVVHRDILVVFIRWSKTNQFGERVLRLPLVPIQHSPLCPVTAFKHMISLVPASPDHPLFVVPNRKKLVPVRYLDLQHVLKLLVSLSGRDPSKFSSHSFRRGGASWAFKANVPGEMIQVHGDWVSDAYKRYLHFPMSTKLSVVKKMRDLILQ